MNKSEEGEEEDNNNEKRKELTKFYLQSILMIFIMILYKPVAIIKNNIKLK